MNILQTLGMYLSYPFVRYAIIVGVLIALCSSLLGVTLVLKRFSFIGDGLSHVAFGAMAVASVLKMANQMMLVLPVTILCAILLLRPRGILGEERVVSRHLAHLKPGRRMASNTIPSVSERGPNADHS